MGDAATSRGTIWLRCAALVVFSALIYFPGLTGHGLTNWQEAVRLVVAREMHERDAWLVPTRQGEPYLAKPPMIYWVQRGFALARGDRAFTDEFELRATVALFGVIGVVVTYLAARRLLGDARAAWWGAVALAVGILYVRSARIGELDILLVPFVVTAVACLVQAWRPDAPMASGRWWLIGTATIAAVGATLTKGPPALLTIVLGGYASAIAWGTLEARATPGLAPRLLAAAIGAGALVAMSVGDVRGLGDVVGVALFALIGSALGVSLLAAMQPASVRGWWMLVARAHPWMVLGVPLLAFLGWGRLVAREIGAEKLAKLAQTELDDNLRLLVAESPVNNLGFFAYGVAPLGVLGFLALVAVLARRDRRNPGVVAVVVWMLLGFAAFSTLGKGVARYLTPLWPALAMLAGVWVSRWLAAMDDVRRRRGVLVLAAVAIVAGVGQSWWYGAGRERYEAARSGRAIAGELPRRIPGFDPARCGTYLFDSPDLEYYLGDPIEEWGKAPKRLALDGLRAQVAATPGVYVLLVREPTAFVLDRYGDAREQLAAAGLGVEEVIDFGGMYIQPPGRVPVQAWILRAIPPAAAP